MIQFYTFIYYVQIIKYIEYGYKNFVNFICILHFLLPITATTSGGCGCTKNNKRKRVGCISGYYPAKQLFIINSFRDMKCGRKMLLVSWCKIFHLIIFIAEGTVQVYVCIKRECHGRAHAPVGTYNLHMTIPHECVPNPAANIVWNYLNRNAMMNSIIIYKIHKEIWANNYRFGKEKSRLKKLLGHSLTQPQGE